MLERVLRFSLQHRFLVVLLSLGAGVLGIASFQNLPIDAVPDITSNQIQINTLFPALSPVEVEKQITFPVQTALAGIPGLEITRSFSRNGFSQVTAVFHDDVDIYFARQQVVERLAAAKESMPAGAEPKMGPVTTGLGEVYMWVIEYEHPDGKGAVAQQGKPGWQPDGTYLTPEGQHLKTEFERTTYLRTIEDWVVRPQISNVKDVAGVDVVGGYEKQYHVMPDPVKLVSYGLGFSDVAEALEKNNLTSGAGLVEHNGEAYVVRADSRITDPDEIGNIVLGTRGGTPVYVRDIATVGIGSEIRTGSGSEHGRETVIGTALMLLGANSRTVALAVDAKLKDVQKTLPPDIRARTVLDRTKLVNSTIATVQKNLLEGAILVIAVLFLMLGNLRAALLTAMAIPLSMLLTMTGMVQAKISGNLMSLGAIDFGLIVDGAVIMVENCLRHLAEKQHALGRTLNLKERMNTVFTASKEVRSATAFGEAIIIMVYIPILTLTGVEGKMFKPMAATVIFALVAAFILSLTFIPAAVAIVIRGRVREKENWLIAVAKWIYRPILKLALKLRYLVAIGAVAAFIGSLLLFMRLGQEFVPTLDEGDILVEPRRIPSISIDASTDMQMKAEKVLESFPEVQYAFSKTGTAEVASDPMPVSVGDAYAMLKPREQWPDPAEPKSHLIERIVTSLRNVPGSNYEITQPIQMRFNELVAGIKSDVGVKVFGEDFDQIIPLAENVQRVLNSVPGAKDLKKSQTLGIPVLNISIDRAAVARLGINISDVHEVIATAIGGREAGEVFEGDRRFKIIVRLPPAMRQDLHVLDNLPVPVPDEGQRSETKTVAAAAERDSSHQAGAGASQQKFIPLSSIATITITDGPNEVNRENGKRLVVVQCNVRGRDLGGFVEEAQRRIAEQIKIPSGNWLEWGGQFENLVAARKRLSIVVPICLFLIFLMLFTTFNSVRYALLVFTGVPLALTGGIVALWVRDMPFSISAAVGFIALSGVAVLNGLVMVTFINHLRRQGTPLEDAIVLGSMTRLRPVLTTALVASLGFVPMALATARGSEVQRPLATVVIGGIISSTILTLVVLPAIYRLWHRRDHRLALDHEHLLGPDVRGD